MSDAHNNNNNTETNTKTVNTPTNSNAPLTLNHTQQVALNEKEVLNHTQKVNQTEKEVLNHTKQAEATNAIVKTKDIINARKEVYKSQIADNIDTLKKLLLLDLVLALLTTFFFASTNVAYIGFSLYTFIVSLLLVSFLNKNNLTVNKSSFKWLIPINLIAFSNALFYTNTHTLNIFIVHILFGIMLIKATNTHFTKVYDFSLFRRVLSNFIPNFTFTGLVLNKIFVKQDSSFSKKSKSNFISVVIGIIVALPVLFIVSILLGRADANFNKMLDNILFIHYDFGEINKRIVYFLVAFVIFLFYSTKVFSSKIYLPVESKKFKINPVTITTFLILLNVVYVLFLYLQVQYVFTDGLFALPSDFTYSEYARDGFFPTFNVTVINLCLITFIVHFTTMDFSNKAFKTNFIIMFTSNVLLIINALNRMYLYIAAYGYTTLRILPTLGLVLIFVLMLLLGLYIVKNINFYKYALISFVVFYVVQAYICNDIVTTHLNFNKFNVTFSDLTLNDEQEFVLITEDLHVLDFTENVDTYWYYSRFNPGYVSRIPIRHYAETAILNYYNDNDLHEHDYEDNYLEVYEKAPFYTKTILQLILENIWY